MHTLDNEDVRRLVASHQLHAELLSQCREQLRPIVRVDRPVRGSAGPGVRRKRQLKIVCSRQRCPVDNRIVDHCAELGREYAHCQPLCHYRIDAHGGQAHRLAIPVILRNAIGRRSQVWS